jgi:AraC family transcriptional regulator of adaptative response/methylated-DNA-[protein]-cysteine methyltransferase
MAAVLLRRRAFTTPVGPMAAFASDAALVALEFAKADRHDRLEARLARWLPAHVVEEGTNGVLERVAVWLDGYFAGRDADATALSLDMHGTVFERRVWEQLLAIPPGQTRSYGELAQALGLRNGARAVGLANGANPLAIVVPCHRVIGTNGSLTGYGGGLDRKQWLLDHERRWSPTLTLFGSLFGTVFGSLF